MVGLPASALFRAGVAIANLFALPPYGTWVARQAMIDSN
jgi:hypothetical protein